MDKINIFEIFIAVFLIFETFINIITVRKNYRLEKDKKLKFKLYKNNLKEIQLEKNECNNKIDEIINDIKNNKIYNDIKRIEKLGDRGEYLCPYHDQIVSEYEKFQNEICSKLDNMKIDKESKLEDTISKILNNDEEV